MNFKHLFHNNKKERENEDKNVPCILSKQKNIFKNPRKFDQHVNCTTAQIFSNIRNPLNSDITFVCSRAK